MFVERCPAQFLSSPALKKLPRHARQERTELPARWIEIPGMVNQPDEHILSDVRGFHLIACHEQRKSKDGRLVDAVKRRESLAVSRAESSQQINVTFLAI